MRELHSHRICRGPPWVCLNTDMQLYEKKLSKAEEKTFVFIILRAYAEFITIRVYTSQCDNR